MTGSIKVNVDALRGDADVWDHKASEIEPVKGGVPILSPLFDLPTILDPLNALCQTANEVSEQLNTLTAEAIAEFGRIAGDLRLNASAYEAQEVEIGQHVKDAY